MTIPLLVVLLRLPTDARRAEYYGDALLPVPTWGNFIAVYSVWAASGRCCVVVVDMSSQGVFLSAYRCRVVLGSVCVYHLSVFVNICVSVK